MTSLTPEAVTLAQLAARQDAIKERAQALFSELGHLTQELLILDEAMRLTIQTINSKKESHYDHY